MWRFTGELLTFQQHVLEWALTKKNPKGILGLDMGLGKTVITLALLAHKQHRHSIIVMPLAVVEQWYKAIQQFTNLPINAVVIYQGPQRKNVQINDATIIVTTYDIICHDLVDSKSVLAQKVAQKDFFDCLVLDEAQRIRNRKTTTFKDCAILGQNCDNKWLLTGTAIYNDFKDLYNLGLLLDIPNYNEYLLGGPEAICQWKKEYYFHLLKNEVDEIKLPTKIVHTHPLDFDDDHACLYLEVLAELKEVYLKYQNKPTLEEYNMLLIKILRLRQICNHQDAFLNLELYQNTMNHYQGKQTCAKFCKILEIINNTPKNDQLIIFSQWTHSLNLLGQFLSQSKISYLIYTGELLLDKKNDILRQFKEPNAPRILLMTITSGGLGLNLNCANHVILLDAWWNQATEDQAIDRVYRIGQKKPVSVHYLFMKDSIEKWMFALKEQKKIVDFEFHQNNIQYTPDRKLLTQILHTLLEL